MALQLNEIYRLFHSMENEIQSTKYDNKTIII